MTINIDDLDDPRPDHQRAANAALGTAVAHAAQELLAEGESPRAVATAFLPTSLAISLSCLGKEATVALLEIVPPTMSAPWMDGGCAGSA